MVKLQNTLRRVALCIAALSSLGLDAQGYKAAIVAPLKYTSGESPDNAYLSTILDALVQTTANANGYRASDLRQIPDLEKYVTYEEGQLRIPLESRLELMLRLDRSDIMFVPEVKEYIDPVPQYQIVVHALSLHTGYTLASYDEFLDIADHRDVSNAAKKICGQIMRIINGKPRSEIVPSSDGRSLAHPYLDGLQDKLSNVIVAHTNWSAYKDRYTVEVSLPTESDIHRNPYNDQHIEVGGAITIEAKEGDIVLSSTTFRLRDISGTNKQVTQEKIIRLLESERTSVVGDLVSGINGKAKSN